MKKAHPLEFPMGNCGLYDAERPREVTTKVWVQHLLRLSGGWCVHGLRGHRLVWALVNTLLLSEAQGKGYVVQKNVLGRMGARLGSEGPLTRESLRAAVQDEAVAGSLVHTLMTVGQGVRSTPMQWGREGKLLDCAVKILSWAPPWVKVDVSAEMRAAAPRCYLGDNEEVPNLVGYGRVGRIPAAWFTLNYAYNFDYDAHRLNVVESVDNMLRVLRSNDAASNNVRFRFARDSPDVITYLHALRAELLIKIVVPTILGSSKDCPSLVMARYENGPGGNPHWHCLGYGDSNPRMDDFKECVSVEQRSKSDPSVAGAAVLGEGDDVEEDSCGDRSDDALQPVGAYSVRGSLAFSAYVW